MHTYSSIVEKVIRPALADYRSALEIHAHDFTRKCCKCGWVPRRPGSSWRRAVGIHLAAADKRANKAYEASSSLALDRFHALANVTTEQLVALYAQPNDAPIRFYARSDKMAPEVRRLIWLELDRRGSRFSSEAS